jgi:hypothetical protein
MSTQQVERLTALLARVQRNRSASRAGNGAPAPQPVAAIAPPAAAPAPRRAEVPVPPAPVAPVAPAPSAPSRGRHAPTPLEMALEGRVSQPSEQFASHTAVAPAPAPVPAAAPARAAGRVLAEPITPEPSKPIVQVVSKQPPHAAASFGELLKRSLSLRPR